MTQTDAWAMAFGCIVGWGAFVMPGTTFLPVAGPLGTLVAMAVGVVLMVVLGVNFAVLMKGRLGKGGMYAYTKDAFGRAHAFLCAWFLCLSYISIVFLNATALPLVLRTLFGDVLRRGVVYRIVGHDVFVGETASSIAVLLAVALLLWAKESLARRLQTILACVLLVGSLTAAAVCLPQVPHVGDFIAVGKGSPGMHYGIIAIILLAPWAFVGFETISMETEDFCFNIHKSLKIILLAIILGGVVYGALTLVSVASVPDGYGSWRDYIADIGRLKGTESVAAFHGAYAVMGKMGLVVLGAAALAAILTGVIGGSRATRRLLCTMADDQILPKAFSRPAVGIAFVMVISILLTLLGRNTLVWFVELTSLGAIVAYGYVSASVYHFASEESRGVRLNAAIGVAIAVVFGVVQLIPRLTMFETIGSQAFLMIAMWCLLGFLFYWRSMRHSGLAECQVAPLAGAVLFAFQVYATLMWFFRVLLDAAGGTSQRSLLISCGVFLVLFIFFGLFVMLYIQSLLFRRQERLAYEKIHAEESNRAKSRFLFNMSHDIRTPMNAIIGFTHLATRKETTQEEKNAYLAKIDCAGQLLLSIINDVLDMSRIESGRMELKSAKTDLGRLLEDAKDLFDVQMERRGIAFTVDGSELADRWVVCDGKRLARVLLNLIGNACKFTEPGGSVVVTMAQTRRLQKTADYEIRVKDTGIGMSKEFVENVFAPFERERTSSVSGAHGTGLGLAITKSIVDMMEGSIQVLSEPGKGSEFIITLSFPLAEPPAMVMTPSTEAAAEASMDFRGVRLLLVEDNEINREIALLMLNEAGFKVETATNGQAAVDAVTCSSPGYYKVILMDIQMPVMDGYAATRAIRALKDKALASIPIVAVTANAFKEDEEACKLAGMQGHVAKPLVLKTLLATLARVLQRQENIATEASSASKGA